MTIRYWDFSKEKISPNNIKKNIEIRKSYIINAHNNISYCKFSKSFFDGTEILQSNEIYDINKKKKNMIGLSDYQYCNGVAFHYLAQNEFDKNDEKMYVNAFAHYMMGDKLSADEEKIFAAKNATTTAKENYVVVPTTVRDGIWHEMEERHPVIAATARTHIKGDVDILVDSGLHGLKFFGLLEDVCSKLDRPVDLIDVYQLKNGCDLEKKIHETGELIYEQS